MPGFLQKIPRDQELARDISEIEEKGTYCIIVTVCRDIGNSSADAIVDPAAIPNNRSNIGHFRRVGRQGAVIWIRRCVLVEISSYSLGLIIRNGVNIAEATTG